MIDFKEYTRQRDIMVKRIKRMESKGLTVGLTVPTVKEIKAGKYSAEESMQMVNDFLEYGESLQKKRERQRIHYTHEEKVERKREYQRDYRRRKVAEQYEREEYPTKYREYLKGLKKLKVDIPPSKLPMFFKYMDYRFSQGKDAQQYLFDIFARDYKKMLKKGFTPQQILNDFQEFEADQAAIKERADGMEGITQEEASKLWTRYIDRTDSMKKGNKKRR